MFHDRTDAGKRLGKVLEGYAGTGTVVLAIPRGGAEVGYWLARHLAAEFSLLIARKLPFPDNPESGFGAIAEDGSTFLFPWTLGAVPGPAAARVVEEQRREIARRITVLRKGNPLPELAGRTVILVDDGIAMGSTMRVAVALCRKAGAAKVVVAVPVAGRETVEEFRSLAEEVVVLETPRPFFAVAQAYRHWYDMDDDEVLAIMDRWEKENRAGGNEGRV